MSTLSAERCVAGGRDSPQVTEAEIAELGREIPDWHLVEREAISRLERIFHVPSFADALAFTSRVGALAEEEGHEQGGATLVLSIERQSPTPWRAVQRAAWAALD
jgi:4a-hydroxytetrahydrobiopterin dehydratase